MYGYDICCYDNLSRLLTSTGSNGIFGFTYDKVGNRLSKTENSTTNTYNYTGSSKLNSVVGSTTTNLTYDAIGNTLTKGDLSFTYNLQGRLQTAFKTGMAVEYATNFKGERSTKLFNGTKTHYIYNLQGQLIAEADNAGAIQKEYIYLNGQRLATVTTGAVYYVHTDHLDTPIALTDQSGLIQWKASYTPFGKAIVEINNLENNIRFPGQYFDSETGLHYNYFRDYDPEIGRYIQSDPIGLAGGINTYGYVGGNPVGFVDPAGLAEIWIGGFNDDGSGIVENYYNSYNASYPGISRSYYEWGNTRKIVKYIKKLLKQNKCEQINIIGHSYGGSDATKLAERLLKAGIGVNLLITVDPVSRGWSQPDDLSNVSNWININANPANENASDTTAWWGGKWGDWPKNRANIHYKAPYNHENFRAMMNYQNNGVSAFSILHQSSKDCSCSNP